VREFLLTHAGADAVRIVTRVEGGDARLLAFVDYDFGDFENDSAVHDGNDDAAMAFC
jgi:hypothetical protein